MVTGSVPSPPAPVDVKKNQRSMTESKVETENNRQETQQKSRTLSSVSALRGMSVASDKKVGKITDEHRSASVEGVNADNKESGEVMQRKSSKGRSKLEFRMSIPVNKKRLKSMFRSNKDDHTPPKIEVSGPITCDLMGTASNDDYLVPLSDSSKKNENPYDQVTVDHGQSEDRAGVSRARDILHGFVCFYVVSLVCFCMLPVIEHEYYFIFARCITDNSLDNDQNNAQNFVAQ